MSAKKDYPMTLGVRVEMVKMPNHLMILNDTPFPVQNLTEQEANDYAEFMRLEFIKHWKTKRANLKSRES
jgi:hypothetical protein